MLTVASAVMLALVFSLFILRLAVVSGDSMTPTYHDRDVLVTLPLAYCFDEVSRGDVVMIKRDSLTSGQVVKRVMAVSGETVEIRKGRVYINGDAVEDSHYLYDEDCNFGPLYVSDGCCFVLGDNRAESVDSRLWEQPLVGEDEIKGRVVCKIFPIF